MDFVSEGDGDDSINNNNVRKRSRVEEKKKIILKNTKTDDAQENYS